MPISASRRSSNAARRRRSCARARQQASSAMKRRQDEVWRRDSFCTRRDSSMAQKMASRAAPVAHERFGADRTSALRSGHPRACLCPRACAPYAPVLLARSHGKKGTFMSTITTVLAALVAAEHLGFLVLEMFLWQKPIGLRIFRLSPDTAATSAALAANQGLYNGFLAAGIVAGLAASDPGAFRAHRVFAELRHRRRHLRCVHRVVANAAAADRARRGGFGRSRLPALARGLRPASPR